MLIDGTGALVHGLGGIPADRGGLLAQRGSASELTLDDRWCLEQ
jgi:hypothetical protein